MGFNRCRGVFGVIFWIILVFYGFFGVFLTVERCGSTLLILKQTEAEA